MIDLAPITLSVCASAISRRLDWPSSSRDIARQVFTQQTAMPTRERNKASVGACSGPSVFVVLSWFAYPQLQSGNSQVGTCVGSPRDVAEPIDLGIERASSMLYL